MILYYSKFLLSNFLNRNLDVGEDDGIGKDADEDDEDIVPGLQCKILVRFDNHNEFCKALKVLCGRSLQKVTNIVFFYSTCY